jgi:subfamily B ATP-binding cassette protein MsbA
VIAHRLSTIRRADQILVVEAGRIVERGTHETLYDAGGRYFDLYTKQHAIQTNIFLAPGEETTETEDRVQAETTQGGQTTASESALPEAMRLIRGQN